MAGPFIGLALNGANKVIDQHFDKLPEHVFHPNTYSVKKSKRQRGKEKTQRHLKEHYGDSSSSSANDEAEPSPDDQLPDAPRHSGAPLSNQPPQYVDSPMHSQQPPQPRREYVPRGAPESIAGSYTEPPPPRYQYDIPPPTSSAREYRPSASYYSPPPPPQNIERGAPRDQFSPPQSPPRSRGKDAEHFEYPRIPKSQYIPPPPIGHEHPRSRRSSAYIPPPPVQLPPQRRPRGRSLHGDSPSDSHPLRRPKPVTRRSSSYHHSPRSRDYGYVTANDRIRERRDYKAEKKDMFTDSGAGLTGAAAGALAGGLAANQVQKGGRGKEDPNVLMTLLGAAVGGLAVNAAVDKMEERKEGTERVLHGRSGSGSVRSHHSRRYRDSRGYGSDDAGSRFDEGLSRTGSGKSGTGMRMRRHRESFRGYGSDGYE